MSALMMCQNLILSFGKRETAEPHSTTNHVTSDTKTFLVPLVCDGEGQASSGQGEASSGYTIGAPQARAACQE